jgi:hypothetical protein
VRTLEALADNEAVVVTDIKDPQAVYDRLTAALGTDNVLFPNVLRLSKRGLPRSAAAQ